MDLFHLPSKWARSTTTEHHAGAADAAIVAARDAGAADTLVDAWFEFGTSGIDNIFPEFVQGAHNISIA